MLLAVLLALVPPLFTGLWTEWIYRALVLLVIACPCALVISTPVAVVSAMASAARQGVILKGGAYLEELGRAHAVAFDKTGTITSGQPKVTRLVPANESHSSDVLTKAASLAQYSTHPLSQAIVEFAQAQNLPILQADSVQNYSGRGITASIQGLPYYLGSPGFLQEQGIVVQPHPAYNGCSVVALGSAREQLGTFYISDEIRQDMLEVIHELKQRQIEHIYLLTGDQMGNAEHTAREVGIEKVSPVCFHENLK